MAVKKEKIKEAKIIEEEKETIKEEKKETTKKYASFLQRLCAFIIDMVLVSFITSIVTQPFTNGENLQKLSDETYEAIDQYQKQKIDINTYVNRTVDISYDMARASGLSSIIGIAISVLYFVIYQLKAGGQTLGKKLLKIKVVKADSGDLNMNDFLFRSLIANFILFDIISLCFSVFSTKNTYFYGVGIFQFIQYIIVFISCLMILSKKDKQSLHDIIVKTEVVRV